MKEYSKNHEFDYEQFFDFISSEGIYDSLYEKLAKPFLYMFSDYHQLVFNMKTIYNQMIDHELRKGRKTEILEREIAADYKFLQNLLPSNNYGIGGSISLNQDPVIKLTNEQARHLLDDFHRLRDRKDDNHVQFYRELMGSLCLTMMYDIFEAHAQQESTDTHTDRTAYIVK